MAKRFRGEGQCKLDDKGRLLLPPAIRAVLQGPDGKIPQDERPGLVIVYGGDEQRHLEVYTEASMDELADKVDALDYKGVKPEAADLLYGETEPVEVDGTGRILLRAKFREKLRADGEGVYVIGLGNKFEIWKKEDFVADRAARRADPSGDSSRISRILRQVDEELRAQRRGEANG